MKQSLSLRAGLSLTMTPALQQAIRLLQLSSLDLQTEIRQALESNVMLEASGEEGEGGEEMLAEAAEGGGETETSASESSLDLTGTKDIPEEMPVDADWGDIYDSPAGSGSGSTGSGDDDGLHDYLQANLHGSASLREHLNWQASIAPFDEIDAEIALHLIDAVNDDGYLEDWDGLQARLSAALSLPLLFAAGMTLMDTTDGVLMTRAYDWAFVNPLRRIFYNAATTALSIAAALLIGTVELLQLLIALLGLKGGFFDWVAGIGFGGFGYLLAALLLSAWLLSAALWKSMRVD